jgi:hypothetical protein
MSTRADIIQNVMDSLSEIDSSKDNSFETKVDAVHEGDIFSPNDVSNSVTLGVFIQAYGSSSIRVKMAADNSIEVAKTMTVGIRAVVRSTVDKINGAMSGLVDDIELAMYGDRRRGQSALPVNTPQMSISQELVDTTGVAVLGQFLASVLITWSDIITP